MKTSISQMLPTNDRERQLMEFWYHKGYAEAELMAACKKNKRKVTLYVGTKKRRRKVITA